MIIFSKLIKPPILIPLMNTNHLLTNKTVFNYSTNFPAKFQPTKTTTFSQILQQRPQIKQLKQIHAQILLHSLSSHPSLTSSLIHCYLSCHHLHYAKTLFDNYPNYPPPALLFNLIIRAFSKIEFCSIPMFYFCKMMSVRAFPDEFTFTFVINSCKSNNCGVLCGEMIHGVVIKCGYFSNLFVGNSLIDMYCGFGDLGFAEKVFDEMVVRDVVSWTSVLGGFVKKGEFDKGRRIFEEMPVRNEVSWAVMVSGLVGKGRFVEALEYFDRMIGCSEVKVNEAVLVCALSACAHLGAFEKGYWIHGYLERNGVPLRSNICTALIDMYAKCGRVGCAVRVFDQCLKRDVHNFTSMISGLSIHGLGKDALEVFSKMLSEGVKPNEVTIVGVLNGCSHSGLVDEGTSIFNDMEKVWGVVPNIEHYGCYVDLLARAGHLERAYEVAKSMPMEPDAAIWRALLSACRTHRNVYLGEKIMHHVRQIGFSGEVLVSSLYAHVGKWEGVVSMREQMAERRNKSEIGFSWIEVNGVTHEFRVNDRLHPQISDIRQHLVEILNKAKLGGYVTNTAPVTFDLSEEDKELAVSLHGEKLAIAFGIMNTKPGSLIRIVKNLRTCEDCHLALKAISRVFGREIIVRDRSRFHTFKHGSCSCNDYW